MNNKKWKLKTITIILTIILIIVGTFISFAILHLQRSKNINETDLDSQYIEEFGKECAEMTIEQRLEYKRLLEEDLENLNVKIMSDSINPEERFDALRTRRNVESELEVIKKFLP